MRCWLNLTLLYGPTRVTKSTILGSARMPSNNGSRSIVTPATPGGRIKPSPADPITTTGSSATFKMKIGGGVAPGSYQLTFTGTDGSGHTRTATVTLIVQ